MLMKLILILIQTRIQPILLLTGMEILILFLNTRPAEKDLSYWFNLDNNGSVKADSVNSSGDDKCPFVFRNIMFFASNRPGGLGGFDLYYSVFRKGNWSSSYKHGPWN